LKNTLHGTLSTALAVGLLGAAASPAQAQGAQALNARALAATCANCHGTQGVAVANATVPGLLGLPGPYIVEQMKAFKAGTRPATVMHQLAKGYSDAQIEAIAAYFAAQKK
jgi:cytochrome subunit of sulfide dehydrogenase